MADSILSAFPYLPEAGTAVPAHTHAESEVIGLPTDLNARLKYRGPFAYSTAYALNDIADWRGVRWLCITAHTSSSVQFDSTNWLPLGNRARSALAPARIGGNFIGSLVDQTRTLAPTLNRLYLAPAYTEHQITVDSLNCVVTTAATGGTLRMGIYLNTTNDHYSPLNPGTFALLQEAGVADTSTVGTKIVTFPTPQVIPADTWFFLAGLPQVAAATQNVGGGTNANGFSPWGQGNTGYGNSKTIALVSDLTAGVSLPASVSTSTTSNVDAGVGYHRNA